MPDPDPWEVHLLAAEIAQVFERRDASVPAALSALGAVVEEAIKRGFSNDHDRNLTVEKFVAQLRKGVRRRA